MRAAQAEIFARREARELLELADEMRLVVIAVALDDLHPVDAGGGVQPRKHALEAGDAQIGLRRHADLLGEKADQRLLADLGVARGGLDRDAVRRAGEKLQRQRDGGVMRALPETLRHRAEEDGDLVLRRRRLHNALMQPFGVGAPDIAERDMDVLELARRAAEKGERAARLE